MTLPALFYGFLLSSLYGTAFHFWTGGKGLQLLFYLLLAWGGFWTGHFLGVYFEWTLASLGPIRAGMGTIGSLLFLILGRWLGKRDG
ncbi:MAG: hypothetical protein MAG431_01127 [Chloroflexi bacterium]|nr:hypothetical protein [Chloroflexota bacterium]